MTDKKSKARGLGRGLSALMADVGADQADGQPQPAQPDRHLPIEQIAPNPEQPRRSFSHSDLEELADSIRHKGIIQPLIVRPIDGAATPFQIVAGERRWRAAQIAQLHEVPVIVRDFSDTEALEVAIIENIQRSDLNPIDEAAGYRQLMDRFGHTQEQVASALGKSRSHIANLLRLLNLPDEIKTMVVDGLLSAGHARTLVTADAPLPLARRIVETGMSVRDAERLVKSGGHVGGKPASPRPSHPKKDADTVALENDLGAALKMSVSVEHEPGTESGRITIRYKTLDQLDELCRLLGG